MPSALDWKGLSHGLPQTVHLIKEIEDYAYSLIVDAHVMLQIADQFSARQIDLDLAGRRT